jgi:hypothetical protein
VTSLSIPCTAWNTLAQQTHLLVGQEVGSESFCLFRLGTMLSDLPALDRFAAKRTLIGLPVAKKAPATKQVAGASKSLGAGLELDVEFAVGQGLGRRAVRWRARKRKRAGNGRGRHRADHDAARRGIIKLAAALGGGQHVAGTGRARATQGVGAYCFGHV